MSRSRTSAVVCGLAAVLIAAALLVANVFEPGAQGGAARAGTPVPVPRIDPAHPPVAWGGPDGRRALDGGWIERDDPGHVGLAGGWSAGGFRGRPVTLPYSPNAGVVRGRAGLHSFRGSVAWFRTTFAVGARGDYALRFESVHHRAAVWVDGRLVARHTGAYLPFDINLIGLTAGRHRLVVRADWRSPSAMKAIGWHRPWFNFGGIGREVTLRPLGASALEAPSVGTRLRDGAALVTVGVRLRNRAGAARAIAVRGRLGGAPLRFGPVTVGAGAARTVTTTIRIAHPALWSPQHPALQDLQLRVPGESGWSARVGLRELGWRGGRLWLNGRALRLHGASIHEDAPGRGDALRPADMDAIVARLKRIGANATRAQQPLSPPLLERLDAAGILVWQEVGPVDSPGQWTSTTPLRRLRALRRDQVTVEQERAHPSVLLWTLGNEVAGEGQPGGQPRYVDAAARMLHRLDPGRPVALDVWGNGVPADAGGLLYRHVDVIGVTMYEGWYQRPGEPLAQVAANLEERLRAVHSAFVGRPVVVTEFGAEGNTLNAPAAPGGLDYQAQLLPEEIRVFRGDRRLDGWLVWALQDFAMSPTSGGGSVRLALPHLRLVPGVNEKGLFTYDGRPKPAVAAVRRAGGSLHG